MPKPKLITARASVNLPGLPAGGTALVDPTEPRVAALLRTELLVNEEPVAVEQPAMTIAGGRSSVKPKANTDTSGGTEPASRRPRPRAASEASQTGTE